MVASEHLFAALPDGGSADSGCGIRLLGGALVEGAAHHLGDADHDRVEDVVLRRVDRRDAHVLEDEFVVRRDDPADDEGDVVEARLPHLRLYVAHQRYVTAGQDRQSDHVGAGLLGFRHDLGRGLADAVIGHVESDVAGAERDLLGAI